MSARTIQIRAALLAVIALALIAAVSTGASAATTSRVCPENPYTETGRVCIEQASVRAGQVTVVRKLRRRAANKHRLSPCTLIGNPYIGQLHCH